MQEIYNTYIELQAFEWTDIFLRLIFASLFGFYIGADRESKNKPVDFRVYIIVAVSTTVIAIMTQEINAHFDASDNLLSLDLGKVIAGTLTGIGFLGAGAIIKINDDEVVGTATGASIWACGIMGLCLGFGLYGLSFALFSVLAVILTLTGFIRHQLSNMRHKK